ncbi:MAG: putative RNA methyltransferase [Turneriella sp.]|nr:putative RNA methyltransferase [Turneriella sp.]
MDIRRFKPGALVELKCHHFVNEGVGLSYFADETLKEKFKPHVFFIWGVLPGEHFVARLAKVKSKVAYGVLASQEEVANAFPEKVGEQNFSHDTWALFSLSQSRVESECAHFLRCGGCKMRHLSYKDSLKYKEEWLRTQLTHHKIVIDTLDVDYPSETERLHYRNHIQVHINKFGVYGFYEPLSYHTYPFPEHGCLIFDEKSIRKKFPKFPVAVRAVRIRQNSDKTTIFTVLNSKDERNTKMRYTVNWPPNSKTHIDFLVTQFFQVNLQILPRWLSTIAEYMPKVSGKKLHVLELFSGFGFISRMLSQVFDLSILAADILTASDIQEVVFTSQNGENLASGFAENYFSVDLFLPDRIGENFLKAVKEHNPKVLLVNPPRAGLTHAVWSKLRESALDTFAGTIIYSSCNASTMARDLGYLQEEGWRVKKIQLFDFFPWTHHFETVTVLEKVE